MKYVANHPYVNDPVRPGKVDRVIASTLAFGTTETFTSEYTAYKAYPQIVIALKNQLHRLRKLGIAPIAASGQFGAPLGATSSTSTTGTTGTTGTSTGIIAPGFNSADNASLGDVNGMSLPAVLNEVISVTGTYPFPFTTSPSTIPSDPAVSVIPNQLGPVLVFGNALTIGGTASTSTTGTTATTTTTTSNTAGVAANVITYTAADFTMYNDRITGAANRSPTTDFAAPAIDVPTFRRTFSLVSVPSGTSTSVAGDPNDHLTFSQVGTSMSSAIVTGAYSLVASALNYWISLNQANGVTSDAYLTTPVGVDSLNFGAHAIKNLSVYNNPDGINGILAYTAVPAADVNDAGSLSTPPLLATTDKQNSFTGTTSPPSYARVSVGNAIASIEGTIAINYLLSHNHNDFHLIDANGDGIITAQELQNFTDTAASKGLAEAGAMAALLGGTATYAQPETGFLYPNNTVFNENPDQPAALQRRFNYFDYLANGQLQGGISISSFKMLANTLLPQPDSYVIVDRQRASANGFLVAPLAQRNFEDLQHLLPKYMFVPPSAIKKYRNLSPLSFGVNKNEKPGTALPFYSLFGGGSASVTTGAPVVRTATTNGQTFSVSMVPLLPASSSSTLAPHHDNDTDYALREHDADDNEHDCDDNEHDSGDREHDSGDREHNSAHIIDDDAGCPGRDRVDDHLNNRDRRAGDCRRGNPARERTECVLELAKQPGARRNLDAGATDHLHDFRDDRKYQHRQHHHCEPDDDRGKYHDRDADHDRGKYHDRNADHDGHPARHRIGVSGRGKYLDRDADPDRDANHDRDADHDGHPGRQCIGDSDRGSRGQPEEGCAFGGRPESRDEEKGLLDQALGLAQVQVTIASEIQQPPTRRSPERKTGPCPHLGDEGRARKRPGRRSRRPAAGPDHFLVAWRGREIISDCDQSLKLNVLK